MIPLWSECFSRKTTITLFTQSEQELLEKIKNIDVDILSPIEALNFLHKIKKKYEI